MEVRGWGGVRQLGTRPRPALSPILNDPSWEMSLSQKAFHGAVPSSLKGGTGKSSLPLWSFFDFGDGSYHNNQRLRISLNWIFVFGEVSF